MSGDTKRVLEVNQIDNLQGSTQRVKQETTLNNLRGFTQRVYVVGGGSAPVIDELNVTPSTSAQTITATSGTDGYSPVNVSAVTSAIDANITSSNIKSGVTILGVSGSVTELNGTTTSVTPTISAQTITPTSPNNGFTEVNVSAVTSAIDANIVAGNIKKDVSILGVTGSYKGVAPSGTKNITANGVYDVTDFASADVQVPTTAPAHYVEKTVDANGKLQNSTNIINLNGVTDVGEYVLGYAYANVSFPSNTSLDLSGLTITGGSNACSNMFYGGRGLTSVDLSGLTTISGQNACSSMFASCWELKSVDLSGLTTVSGNNGCNSMFSACFGLTSIDLSGLTTISGNNACTNMFRSCTSLTSLSFPALTSASFGTQTTHFNNLIYGVTGCTIHFPSNLDPQSGSTVISSLTGYPNFGGTNTVLAFDLPATES